MADEQKDWDRDDYGEDDEDFDEASLQSSADLDDDPELVKHEDNLSQSSKESQESEAEDNPQLAESQSCIEIEDDDAPFPVPNQVRITNPYMSKYQRAAILGKRAEQIANGSPIYISIDWTSQNLPNPLEVAEQELKQGKIPFIVRRNLPSGEFEDWKIEELKM